MAQQDPSVLQQILSFAQDPNSGLGLQPFQAAALGGHAYQESGFNPTATGDHGTSYGLFQLHDEKPGQGRMTNLMNAFPNTYHTVPAQLQQLKAEFLGPEKQAFQALQNSKDLPSAVQAVSQFERFGDNSGPQRLAYAQAIANGQDPSTVPTILNGSPAAGAMSAQNTLGQGALRAGQDISKADDTNPLTTIGAGLNTIAASIAGISNPAQAAQLNAAANSILKQGQHNDFHISVLRDGSIIRTDDRGGVHVVSGPNENLASNDTNHFAPFFHTDPVTGRTIGGIVDQRTGQSRPFDESATSQGAGATGGAASLDPTNLPNDFADFQKAVPTTAATVLQIARGDKAPPPTGTRNPINNMINAALGQYGQSLGYDPGVYTAKVQFNKNLGTDNPSQPGGQLVSLNHNANRIRQAAEAGADLTENALPGANASFGIGNVVTAISNRDSQRNRALNSTYTASVDQSVGEQTRLYSGTSGGGVGERAIRREAYDGPPAEKYGAFKAAVDAIVARGSDLRTQALSQGGMTPEQADKRAFFSPEALSDIKATRAAMYRISPDLAQRDGIKPDGTLTPQALHQQITQQPQPPQPGIPQSAPSAIPQGWGVRQISR